MAIQKTEAIVLGATKLRETSLITTFLTRDFGKIKAISKGVRQEGSFLTPLYEPFSHVQIVFYEKTRSDIHFLSESAMLCFFPGIRADFEKISWASFLLELTETVLPLEEKNEALFELLLLVLHCMEGASVSPFVSIFEVKLLWGSGLFPSLGSCLRCSRTDFETAYLNVEDGGIFCEHCRDSHRIFYPVPKGLIRTIHFFAENDFSKCLTLKLSPENEAELHRLTYQWIRGRFDRDLSTMRFLREVSLF
ncbi:MAG TPA: DNA repair protein RecO [Candidatus Omnitrophota bacterium]|nr:DNA repair protein RecO [Candidatus Omnitrophota bacterium]